MVKFAFFNVNWVNFDQEQCTVILIQVKKKILRVQCETGVRKQKWHGCINKYVFISVLHLLTLSGRFRVGFGVGHDRALTFSFLVLNYETQQYVPVAT